MIHKCHQLMIQYIRPTSKKYGVSMPYVLEFEKTVDSLVGESDLNED